jgi:hypothetical protein
MMVTAMISLSEDFRRLAACYRGLVERAAQPQFKERFAKLAALYDAIADWREAFERTAAFDPEASGSQ